MSDDPIRSDFRNFLFLVWQHLNLPAPTPRQYELAEYLQFGPKRGMIQAFRGVGKSYVTSAYVAWLLFCNPLLNILVVSASKDRSDQFSIFTKRLIEDMPLLEHLKPKTGQRDSNIAFDVGPAGISHSPSVKSVGITGQLTGSRADVIVADDIESLNNSLTTVMREQLAERIKEFDAVLKPLPTSRIIYLGTPQSEMSLYNQLPERGYDIRVWPARVPKDPEKYRSRLAPKIYEMIERGVPAGTPTDPDRFNEIDLAEREASYGRSGFALQFMLDVSLSDADRYPLKLADLIVMRLDPRMAPAKLVWCQDPEKAHTDLPSVGLTGDRMYRPMWVSDQMSEYTGSVMAIDPSGRGKDETGWAIVKILHGNLYLVDAGGFRDGYSEETLKALAVIAKTHAVNSIRVEPNMGDGMFTQLLRPVVSRIHPVEVLDDERSTGQKELRIADVMEPLMNQHRLIVDAKLVERDSKSEPAYQLFYQMTRLTRDRGALKHDDRLDAVAQACAYWIEHMSRDTDQAHKDHLEELRDADLQKFAENILGPDHFARQNLWMDDGF